MWTKYHFKKLTKTKMKKVNKAKRRFKKSLPYTIPLLLAVLFGGGHIHASYLALNEEVASGRDVEINYQEKTIRDFCSLEYVDCDTDEVEIKKWVWVRLNQHLGYDEAVIGMNIIGCESNWNPDAMGVNNNRTVDLGLWQINSIHKNISNQQKLDYQIATDWAINKRIADKSWHAWTCYR